METKQAEIRTRIVERRVRGEVIGYHAAVSFLSWDGYVKPSGQLGYTWEADCRFESREEAEMALTRFNLLRAAD